MPETPIIEIRYINENLYHIYFTYPNDASDCQVATIVSRPNNKGYDIMFEPIDISSEELYAVIDIIERQIGPREQADFGSSPEGCY